MSAGASFTDPSFPQLDVARDPELMREVFQKHLRPLGGKTYRIRECRIYHTRYRPAIRCMLQYTLHLEEVGTGREWSQSVTCVMHAEGRARRFWERLRGSGREREILGAPSAFEPFSYIADLDMLVQVFPYDHQLPALSRLMAEPLPEFEPLLLARFGPGDWRSEAWDVETVRYLAEERATLRLTMRARNVVTGRAEERRFYAKVYRNEEKGEQTHHVLWTLWDKANAGGARFTVGRPIAYLSDLRLLIQEEVAGTSLKDTLFREEDPIPAVRKAARTLAALHLDHISTPRRHNLDKEIANLWRGGEFLQKTCPHLRSEIAEILGAVAAGLEGAPSAPTHCDLGLDHILLDGERLALVDLDVFAEADPLLDVAQILSQLVVRAYLDPFPHVHGRTVAQAFAEEYFAHVPEAWRARLSPRYAGAILKRAAALCKSASSSSKRRAPGLSIKIEILIEEARDSLAGRVW